jgi:hypothetical protein
MNNELVYMFILFMLASCNIYFPIENLDLLIGLGVVLLQPLMVFHSCILYLMPIGMVLCMLCH